MDEPIDPATRDDIDQVLREVAMTGQHTVSVRVLRRALEFWQRSVALTAEYSMAAPAPFAPELPRGTQRCRHEHPDKGRCTRDVGHPAGRGGGHHYLDQMSEVTATVPAPRAPRRFSEGLPSVAG